MRHVLAALLLLAPVSSLADVWTDDYRRGLEALEHGELDIARAAFERALAAHPSPEASARTYGARSLGYFPHLQLSIVAYRQGELETAEAQLALSRQAGVAGGNEEGRELLEKQALLVGNLRLLRSADAGTTAPDSMQRQRTERDLLREKLLARKVAAACGERAPDRDRARPWYYHYLIALELAEHGDSLGALGRIVQALEKRDEPSESARTYGMKVISYRPYFELGRAHARLGNWSFAADALALSERLEKFDGSDERAARERRELLAGARLRSQG